MTKINQLRESIRVLAESGVRIPEELLTDVTRIEQEIIREENGEKLQTGQRSHTSKLKVIFPDGEIIECKKAAETLCKTIEKIGPARVASLGIRNRRHPLVSKEKSETYNQFRISFAFPVDG